MAKTADTLDEQRRDLPDQPGVYLFSDSTGRVIYVGKARTLRKRLANYWSRPLHPRTEAMVTSAASVEWIVASGEVDALMRVPLSILGAQVVEVQRRHQRHQRRRGGLMTTDLQSVAFGAQIVGVVDRPRG